jgi:hypothetical protein
MPYLSTYHWSHANRVSLISTDRRLPFFVYSGRMSMLRSTRSIFRHSKRRISFCLIPAKAPSSFELDDDLLQDHFLGRDRVAGHIHRHELQPIA